MAGRLIEVARSAYQYPLLIKQLLHAPMVQAPDQQIVYRDLRRLTYADLRDRIGRLANCLKMLGVRPGDTVGVMDWDSNRFLEAFFAVPMMGAILQTVNVRLSPEQITHTINHAGPSVLLVNDEFVGLVQSIKSQLDKVRTFEQAAARLLVTNSAFCPASLLGFPWGGLARSHSLLNSKVFELRTSFQFLS